MNIFDFFAFLKDLYAKIAIGISVQPRIIFLHLILIKLELLLLFEGLTRILVELELIVYKY